jgi:D-inositol-3-phosphate glycosyltransferase
MTLRLFFASSSELLTDHRGHGEGLIASALLEGLANRGHEVLACTRKADFARDPPYEVVELGPGARHESIAPFGYVRRVRQVLRRRGGPQTWDVAHWMFSQSRFDLAQRPVRGLPLVIGPLFLEWPQPRRLPQAPGDVVRTVIDPLVRLGHRHTLESASWLLASVPEVLDRLPSAARRRADVLPIAVDAVRFPALPPTATRRVLFLGRLVEAKGIHVLLEAWAHVRSSTDGAILMVAGEGPELDRVRSRIREPDLAGGVDLVGPVSHDQVPGLLHDVPIVCVPARGEPYGMALLEAMACQRAVVAADLGGPRFLVDDPRGGRRVPIDDPGALAKALIELLTSPEDTARMGAFNRQRVEHEFATDVVLERLERGYRRLIQTST